MIRGKVDLKFPKKYGYIVGISEMCHKNVSSCIYNDSETFSVQVQCKWKRDPQKKNFAYSDPLLEISLFPNNRFISILNNAICKAVI